MNSYTWFQPSVPPLLFLLTKSYTILVTINGKYYFKDDNTDNKTNGTIFKRLLISIR